MLSSPSNQPMPMLQSRRPEGSRSRIRPEAGAFSPVPASYHCLPGWKQLLATSLRCWFATASLYGEEMTTGPILFFRQWSCCRDQFIPLLWDTSLWPAGPWQPASPMVNQLQVPFQSSPPQPGEEQRELPHSWACEPEARALPAVPSCHHHLYGWKPTLLGWVKLSTIFAKHSNVSLSQS